MKVLNGSADGGDAPQALLILLKILSVNLCGASDCSEFKPFEFMLNGQQCNDDMQVDGAALRNGACIKRKMGVPYRILNGCSVCLLEQSLCV